MHSFCQQEGVSRLARPLFVTIKSNVVLTLLNVSDLRIQMMQIRKERQHISTFHTVKHKLLTVLVNYVT